MDYSGIRVPTENMIAIFVTAIIVIGLPIMLAILWRKKTSASFQPLLIGGITFIAFAMILERICHTVVLSVSGTAITGNIWLYALYGGLAAGIFEEVGRFVAMKFFMKGNVNKENAIMYGIGHGGIESIVIAGLSYISNIMVALTINRGEMASLFTSSDEAINSMMFEQISDLWKLQSSMFYMAALERVSTIFLHIALSYLVYRAVRSSNVWLLIAAIAIHAFVDSIMVILVNAFGIDTLRVELLLLVAVSAFVYLVIKHYKKEE